MSAESSGYLGLLEAFADVTMYSLRNTNPVLFHQIVVIEILYR